MRLIDADALKKAMRMWPRTKQPVLIYTGTILKGIEEAPTIDPESLRTKGRWEEYHTSRYGAPAYTCSCCYDIWESVQIKNMKYCPSCGANMEERS